MTAATETSGKYAAIAQDRWDTLTIGIEAPDAGETNSDLLDEWKADTREILGRMVHGIAHYSPSGEAEYDLLCEAEERLTTALEEEAKRLVEAVEPLRTSWKVAAA